MEEVEKEQSNIGQSSSENVIERSEMEQNFFKTYKEFVETRQHLIDELRNVADIGADIRRNCSLATITGSSISLVGGGVALAGSVFFPPLFLGGLLTAGLASLSNTTVYITEFALLKNQLRKVEKLWTSDEELFIRLEQEFDNLEKYDCVYNKLIPSTHFTILGLQCAKGAVNFGLRSVGKTTFEIGGKVVKGVTRGMVGIGLVIDSATLVITMINILKGSKSEFVEKLERLADEKMLELDEITKIIFESIKVSINDNSI